MQNKLMGFAIFLIGLPLYAHATYGTYGTYGFYVGASGTATNWDFDITNDLTLTINPVASQATMQEASFNFGHDDLYYSAEGRIGGYLFWGDSSRWLTAVEVFGGPHDATFNHQVIGLEYKQDGDNVALILDQQVRARYSYGVELKQGYRFAEHWLSYLVIGGLNTFYDLDTAIISTSETNAGSLTVSDNATVHTHGLRFGGGLERFWESQLSMTLQVTYTAYEEIDRFLESSLDLSGIAEYHTDTKVTFDPSALQVSLGLNYYFGI